MHVQALVLRKNNFDYPKGKLFGVSCGDFTSTQSVYWRVPLGGAGVQTGYKYVMSDTKPRPDAVKALKVTFGTEIYFIALTDTADPAVFNSYCDQCCGTNPTMPAVVIPDVINEEIGCADVNGNYNYFTITQALASGQVYTLFGTLNGAYLATAPKDGFVSLAALATWANTNWSPASVAVSGNKVTLTSATGATGSISVRAKGYFDSNAPSALTTGQKYTLAATVDGIVLTPIVGAANGALQTIADAANADLTYSSYGVWSVNSGKIRLVSASVAAATLSVTIS